MGGGIYMPPMMVPAGIRAPHMAPFPPMGLGMGMGMGMGMGVGMGFGMGMVDANGSPLVPAPPPPQYPCASVPATVGLRGMPGTSNLQFFGAPPMTIPRPPAFIPMPTGLPVAVNSTAEIVPAKVVEPDPRSTKDQPKQQAPRSATVDDVPMQVGVDVPRPAIVREP